MNYQILVNKEHRIPDNFNIELKDAFSKYKPGILVEKETLKNFRLMQEEALKNEYIIDVESGFRTHEYQQTLVDNLVKEKGLEYANKYIARTYHSEHETGLAIDICVYENGEYLTEHDLKHEDAVKWIHKNAYRFGFILRYPEGKEDITGYNYEPWHLRYVGKTLSNYLYKNNLTLEEYYV